MTRYHGLPLRLLTRHLLLVACLCSLYAVADPVSVDELSFRYKGEVHAPDEALLRKRVIEFLLAAAIEQPTEEGSLAGLVLEEKAISHVAAQTASYLAAHNDDGSVKVSGKVRGTALRLTLAGKRRSWFARRSDSQPAEHALGPAATGPVSAPVLSSQGAIDGEVVGTAAVPAPIRSASNPSIQDAAVEPVAQPAIDTAVSPAPSAVVPPAPEPMAPEEVATPEPEPIALVSAEPTDEDGATFQVSEIVLEYARPEDTSDARVPSLEALQGVEVTLQRSTDDGWIAPKAAAAGAPLQIGQIRGKLYASAILAINRALVLHLTSNEVGLIGVYVVPSEDDIGEDGGDIREGRTNLTLKIWLSRVGDVRTVGAGERFEKRERINQKAHDHLKKRSRIAADALLFRDELNSFADRASRHPGRRVDLALGSGEAPGEVVVDYIITENKPWLAYANISNEGTASTNRVRERFGLMLNQVTNHDDTAAIEYATSDFEASHAVSGYYEIPVISDRLRLRIDAAWNEFTATDLGIRNAGFTGSGWSAGPALTWNVAEVNGLFADLTAGLSIQNIQVTEVSGQQTADETIATPNVGIRLERSRANWNTHYHMGIEWNLEDAYGNQAEEMEKLGRLATDEDWLLFRYNLDQSVGLDPLFASLHGDSHNPDALPVHELSAKFRGQVSLEDDRLIPQRQRTAGGATSVRGYQESAASGDNVFIFNLDYKFHLARKLFADYSAPAQERADDRWRFRWKPDAQGRLDWSLTLRTFFDYAETNNVDSSVHGGVDQKLMSTGVGADWSLSKHIRMKLDWGYTLEPVRREATVSNPRGESRVHASATILF